MVEKITTETFASDVSVPTQLEFINMILGANSYNHVTNFERLSTLVALASISDN